MNRNSTIWQRLLMSFAVVTILAAPAFAGSLQPSAPPGPTMKSLDEVTPTWSRQLPANDSTTPDGCNSSRFKCVMPSIVFPAGDAVLDKETGLVWMPFPINASSNWGQAVRDCQESVFGKRKGWRLPTIEELTSLLDVQDTSFLPSGSPFLNILPLECWSSTTDPVNSSRALTLNFGDGGTGSQNKTLTIPLTWCVRGGHGYNGL